MFMRETLSALLVLTAGGKSTLVKLIIGFLQPTEGNIHVAYSNSHTPYTIGWVPQHFAYDSHFPISVQDVVLSGRLATLLGTEGIKKQTMLLLKKLWIL